MLFARYSELEAKGMVGNFMKNISDVYISIEWWINLHDLKNKYCLQGIQNLKLKACLGILPSIYQAYTSAPAIP
jgi:hypothetical protein